MPPVAPMPARAAESLTTAEPSELWFEPKWEGFRAVVFRDGAEVEIGSRNQRPLADWFRRFEGAGLDGIIAKPAGGTYEAGKRAQFKIKHRHTAECVVAGYRTHSSGDGVGSLLLGLHDARGVLHYVGAASGFAARKRAELAQQPAPHRVDDGAGHPWTAEGAEGRLPGAPNRWRAGAEAWAPLAGAPVAEVSYDSVLAGRFRHSARLLRRRPDRVPASCGYAQRARTPPVELAEIFGAGGPGPG